jgi:LTXXQ motif family protein
MVSGLLVSLSGLPLPSGAQTHANSLTQLFPALVGVQLTSEQLNQLQSLSQKTLPQLRTVLPPEQQLQFDNALSQGTSVRAAVESLNLSATQRFQIMNILRTKRSQLVTILTPGQWQQVQHNIKN